MIRFKQFVELLEAKEWKAQEGESEILHHVTDQNFDNFRPFSHFGDKHQARGVVARRKNLIHHSVRLKLGNVAHLEHDDYDHTPHAIVDSLHDYGHITSDDHSHILSQLGKESDWSTRHTEHSNVHRQFDTLSKFLNKKGIDTITYPNEGEGKGGLSYMITRPDQVRTLRKRKVFTK